MKLKRYDEGPVPKNGASLNAETDTFHEVVKGNWISFGKFASNCCSELPGKGMYANASITPTTIVVAKKIGNVFRT